ncbi:hypothetical protein ACFCYC_34845 [Streptomyces sp. NPDC056402]|uniref:hypothetical protein n=1 Tax=Streptomyces sp. NPDC056402 TaxID=3345810 RepID=UPI0035D5341A
MNGYVLREVLLGPNGSDHHLANRAPWVPVPVRAGDGTVTVVALPQWARGDHGWWVWARTGWPVDAPRRIVDPPQAFAPSAEVCWKVAVWLDRSWKNGQVLGEDCGGAGVRVADRGMVRDPGRRPADRPVLRRASRPVPSGRRPQHGPDLGYASLVHASYVRPLDAPKRPRPRGGARSAPGLPGQDGDPRAGVARRREAPAHVLAGRVDRHRLANLVWTGWQTSAIAAAVGVGADGAFAWAESWGPRHPDRVWGPQHPDRVLHDRTQEGRELCARLPDTTYAERSALIDAERAAQENALVAALAERGAMTREESSARLERGGTVYRQLLDVGQATICRARTPPAGRSRRGRS